MSAAEVRVTRSEPLFQRCAEPIDHLRRDRLARDAELTLEAVDLNRGYLRGAALQATIPHLTRSALHRCLQRHGISRLPDMTGDKPAKQKF